MGWIEKQFIRLFERMLAASHKPPSNQPDIVDGALALANMTPMYGQSRQSPFVLTTQDRLRHMSVFGASGGGKSWSMLSWLLLHIRDGFPCVVVDSHDTGKKLLKMVVREVSSGRLPRAVLDDILVIDMSFTDWLTRLNPLRATTVLEAFRNAIAMVAILKKVWPDVSWGARTEELTRNLLILLSERALSLADAELLLRQPNELRSHAEQVSNPEARNFFLYRYLQMSASMQRVYGEALLNKLTIFLSDIRIRSAVGSRDNDLDFRTAIDQGKTIIIDLNKGEFLENTPLLGSLMLLSLQKAVFSRIDVDEQRGGPVTILIEEFPSFAGSVTIEPFLNEGRKFGAGMVLVAQTPASLDKRLWQTIRTNCSTQLYFRLSLEDAKVACSGFYGEERELAQRRLTTMGIGKAMFIKDGGSPRTLSFPKLTIPETLSPDEESMIEQMRHNIGRPVEATPTEATQAVREPQIANEDQSQPQDEVQVDPSVSRRLELPEGFRDGGEV